MHRFFLFLAMIAMATLPAAGGEAKGVDWTATVRVMPTGAYVTGNPQARVKLVEYLSYTCPHCSHFAISGGPALRSDFIARGTTSVEMRHAVRDRLDFVATLLARCGGPARFGQTSHAIFANQPEWLDRGYRFEMAEGERIAKLSISEGAKLIMRGAGLDGLMRELGYSDAQLDKCLVDPVQQKLIGAMTKAAWDEAKIPGTPHFLINGKDVKDTVTWADLAPKLQAAAGQ
ncbi:thioredoxin domain-containing protein [uncultured Sphingomonas sp.]|uniref:DsbA family protein n=1 Tax=uncultured Sphingomonas sp. TaxID=158754 RepID=UPI00260A875E|nr:thioredoxin domain-containing protein [uncultured Sphingomonas sp.]